MFSDFFSLLEVVTLQLQIFIILKLNLISETENQASKSVVHLVSSQFTLLLLKVLC